MKIKRRRFLYGALGATGLIGTFGGYKWFQLNRNPNSQYLVSNTSLIISLAECIIPSFKKANSDENLVSLISNCADIKSQNRFINGLIDLEERTLAHFNRSFVKCEPAEKKEIIDYYNNKLNFSSALMLKVEAKVIGKPFFATLKQFTSLTFFTSEFGASEVLRYSHIPGKYFGCIPLEPNQSSWATE